MNSVHQTTDDFKTAFEEVQFLLNKLGCGNFDVASYKRLAKIKADEDNADVTKLLDTACDVLSEKLFVIRNAGHCDVIIDDTVISSDFN